MDLLPAIDSSSLLYLSAFSVITISCIVIFTASSTRTPPATPSSCHEIYPISSSPAEEINAYSHFINYYSNSDHGFDLESQITSQHSQQSSSQSSLKLHVDQQFSQVTLTFGSDRPEVYMKMAAYAQHNLPCRCACNHQSPELAPFPHISNTSTISSNLSAPSPTSDSDSLSTFASNKQLTPTSDPPFSAQLQSTLQSPPSSAPDTTEKTTPNQTWVVINESSASVKNIAPACPAQQIKAPQQLIVKNDLKHRIAYTKMKTLVPFIDPPLFLRWVALKIFISLYILAKGFYQQTLKKPIVRKFQE